MGNPLYEERYWNALIAEIPNEYGVAALMGNLDAESNLTPFRKQGDMDYEGGYPASVSYTNDVDSGAITEDAFVNDSIGYGVAQWTYHTRKQGLYNLKKQLNVSIGDFDLSVKYILQELNGAYNDTLEILLNATEIRTPSNYVLHNYEQPADQSETVEILRANLGQTIYDKYHGVTPPPPTPTPTKKKKMPLWFYLK